MEITTKARLRDVMELNEFIPFGKKLNGFHGIKEVWKPFLRINQLNHQWDSEAICYGLSYLQSLCRQGKKVFYPIGSEEDIQEHTDREEKFFFHFPVDYCARFAIILAGGGYEEMNFLSEAFPTARRLNEMGYHAFVVNYRVGKNALAPNPQDDLADAICYILEHAGLLCLDTEDYAVIGFGAGGHLAAGYGTEKLGYKHYGLPKPELLVLAYPIITMTGYVHSGSRMRLLGRKNVKREEWLYQYSIENQVTEEFPSCFIWQCKQDPIVPPENAQLLVKELDKHNISYIYRTYPGSAHGWGMGEGADSEGWLRQAVKFWEGQK